jgi:Domain of unknown function (DUF6438)
LSSWNSWKVTIRGDGQVDQEIYGLKGKSKKSSRLSQADMRTLVARIRGVRFFSIPEKYDHSVTDQATLILTVTMNKKTHKVSIYALDFVQKDDGVKGFLTVWREILKEVPSPNPKQKPDLYNP